MYKNTLKSSTALVPFTLCPWLREDLEAVPFGEGPLVDWQGLLLEEGKELRPMIDAFLETCTERAAIDGPMVRESRSHAEPLPRPPPAPPPPPMPPQAQFLDRKGQKLLGRDLLNRFFQHHF